MERFSTSRETQGDRVMQQFGIISARRAVAPSESDGPSRYTWVMRTMRICLSILAVAILPAVLCAQSVITKINSPGTRNTNVIYSDDSFRFLMRHHGSRRDIGGNTEPGFFVHSKAHNGWLQILQVSTKDAKFGKSHSDDPDEDKRLRQSSVGWDFTAFTNKAWIVLPLQTSGSIAFPDKIEFDYTTSRYKLSFFTSWKIESAVTVLYVSRKDLREQFDKVSKP
jgi:hypothetical protein